MNRRPRAPSSTVSGASGSPSPGLPGLGGRNPSADRSGEDVRSEGRRGRSARHSRCGPGRRGRRTPWCRPEHEMSDVGRGAHAARDVEDVFHGPQPAVVVVVRWWTTVPGLMNGLIRTLPGPAATRRCVGAVEERVRSDAAGGRAPCSVASWDGSPSPLSVTLVTVPGQGHRVASSSIAWNEAATVGPPLFDRVQLTGVRHGANEEPIREVARVGRGPVGDRSAVDGDGA